MKYEKPALSIDDQADLLLSRNLGADRETLKRRLQTVNYYRLSGYLYHYREVDGSGLRLERFRDGTTLDLIWKRYTFDRRLRSLLLEPLEQIEVALRTSLVYHFVQEFGAFGHLSPKNLVGFKPLAAWGRWLDRLSPKLRRASIGYSEHESWLGKVAGYENRSTEKFVESFHKKYGEEHEHLPLWMTCELMTFEMVLRFQQSVSVTVRKATAGDFGFPVERLVSWSKAMLGLRNICAHHGRILNRIFGGAPSVPGPNKHPAWRDRPNEPKFSDKRAWMQLCVVHCWLGKLSDTSGWRDRLFQLVDEYPEIRPNDLGMPENWRTHPLWQ